jgi:hypothetical protein
MRYALPFLACLTILAFSGLARASFDSAGQPSLAKPEPVQANAPVPKVSGIVIDHWMVVTVNLRAPLVRLPPRKFVVVRNPPPPAKMPIRPRPITK